MATNTNKRIAIKHVRDLAKSAYEKEDRCFVCGSTQDLELHHTNSLTVLLNDWAVRKGYDISTDEGILAVRAEFIAEHRKQVYDDVYTLCNHHHVKLHGIYGKIPQQNTTERQGKWLAVQKEKFESGSTNSNFPTSTGSFFSAFI